MEMNRIHELLKELGWVKDEVYKGEGELYCHSSEYIVGEPDSEPIDTVEIRGGMIYFTGPKWISTNSFNSSNSEEMFLEWMTLSRRAEIDLNW